MSLLEKASDSVNVLCLKLYTKLAGGSQENAFFSPSSISIALAMIYAGAKGSTANEIEQLMDWSKPNTVDDMMQKLQESILSSSGVEVSLANGLWAQQGFAILNQYTDLLKSRYQIEVGAGDFELEADCARKKINKWVEEKTNDKIKNILASGAVGPHTKLVLINAVYFKGSWEMEF